MQNKKTVFISSYPKSGNTWLRSIIGAIYNKNNGKFLITDYKKTPDFSQEKNFKFFENISYQKNGNINFNFLAKHWIPFQKTINNKSKKINFFKTHSLRKVGNYEFTNQETCLGFIYIFRDPRDVSISYAKYAEADLNTAINVMLFKDDNYTNFKKTNEWVSTWKNHYNSWHQFNSVPSLFIKYEEMILEPLTALDKIIKFINSLNVDNIELSDLVKKNILDSTNFKQLQKLEKKTEGPKKTYFFRKGTSMQWIDLLTQKQRNLIENELKDEMLDLGYL